MTTTSSFMSILSVAGLGDSYLMLAATLAMTASWGWVSDSKGQQETVLLDRDRPLPEHRAKRSRSRLPVCASTGQSHDGRTADGSACPAQSTLSGRPVV